jgi:hypothetical protein
MPTKNGGRSARAANGHVTAEQATTLMKSRRRIACPRLRITPTMTDYSRDLRLAKWASGGSLPLNELTPRERAVLEGIAGGSIMQKLPSRSGFQKKLSAITSRAYSTKSASITATKPLCSPATLGWA